HGFAERASERQDDPAEDAGASITDDPDTDHLPARGAERENGFALHRWHREHDLPRDRGDEWHYHDRQDHRRTDHAHAVRRPFEKPGPAECVFQEWLDVGAHQWREHKDSPESVNHA